MSHVLGMMVQAPRSMSHDLCLVFCDSQVTVATSVFWMGCHFWRGRPFYGRAFPVFGDVGRERVGCEVVGHCAVAFFRVSYIADQRHFLVSLLPLHCFGGFWLFAADSVAASPLCLKSNRVSFWHIASQIWC